MVTACWESEGLIQPIVSNIDERTDIEQPSNAHPHKAGADLRRDFQRLMPCRCHTTSMAVRMSDILLESLLREIEEGPICETARLRSG
jgi:hypothetical protein